MVETITIKDIARLSGYSVGTVSRVINQKADVSPETREKVQKIIEEYGFQPNTNAKHLKQLSTSEICILVAGQGNSFFSDLLQKVVGILSSRGQAATIVYLEETTNAVETAARLRMERNPKGFIFLGGALDHFEKGFGRIEVPSVLLSSDASGLNIENLSSYTTDDADASAAAVQYLMDHGHTKIGILGGYEGTDDFTNWRLEGGVRRIREAGIDFDMETQYEACDFSLEAGYTAVRRLFEKQPNLTAVFALSDIIAMGAFRALADMGKKVPEDVSVIGFDGISTGDYSIPRLTTISQNTDAMAKLGVENLLLNISYPRPATHEQVPFSLVERESVAQVRRTEDEIDG